MYQVTTEILVELERRISLQILQYEEDNITKNRNCYYQVTNQ